MFKSWRLRRKRAGVLLLRLASVAVLIGLIAPWLGLQAAAAPRYASIVVDHHTGRVLYARNADASRYPASLTKIMTLYMLFGELEAERVTLKTRLKVSKWAAKRPPSKLGLKPGQTISVSDAIRALVTKSANDVASVVAENLGGSEAKFARMMTQQARALGMKRTTFRNASGLPDSKQVTTARDMAILSRRIMQDYPKHYAYFRLKSFRYKGRRHRNHNRLLFSYKGTDGIKTGYTRASGFNLAASVKRGRKHLVAVVMGGKSSKSRNAHMRSLLTKALPRAVAYVAPKRPMPLPTRNPLGYRPVAVVAALPPAPRPAAVAQPAPSRFAGPAGTVLDVRDPQHMLHGGVARPPTRLQGGFHVQVGAYSSHREALHQLDAVRAKAGSVLDGYRPLTMPLPNPSRYLFRARFAGFDEAAARNTCRHLKRKAIKCVVMRAE